MKNKKKKKDDEEEDSKVNFQDSRFISKDDTLLIKKMYDNNKSFISKNLNPFSDESLLKVNVPERDYKNPYQSLNIISNNHNIYDEVSRCGKAVYSWPVFGRSRDLWGDCGAGGGYGELLWLYVYGAKVG